jgi:formylglycine-generating enzyme required for sulfatase activity
MLGQYAWHLTNTRGDRAWPCGSLLPNDLGLFDMHGNVSEWCQGRYYDLYPHDQSGHTNDVVNVHEQTKDTYPALLRGGDFHSAPASVRSAFRVGLQPSVRLFGTGFRPSRTYP